MRYLIYIILSFVPSFIWLIFYLRKDKKPEPKLMVLKIFIWGMLIAPLVIIAELGLNWLINPSINPLGILFGVVQVGLMHQIIAATLIPALAEEYLKYAVVKTKVIRHSVFDEPTDAMIYCIVSGLGFATVENLMALLNFPDASFQSIIGVITLRFLGATLLHALASATIGYWLAMGLFNIKRRKMYVAKGLILAVIFHSCYNYLILTATNQPPYQQKTTIIMIAILLIGVAIFVSEGFKKLRKQQSICKLNS